jgi:PAS domain S-box-containing protein
MPSPVWAGHDRHTFPVEKRRQKHLVLILAREFASNLATPTLIADEDGNLVFYNEAAEEIVGVPFAEAAKMPIDEWSESFTPRTRDEEPVPPERRPTRITLDEKRPAHERFRITSRDGVDRDIAVTAFPLFAQADEFVGIVAIWWRE